MSQITLIALSCSFIFVPMGPCCADLGRIRTRHQQCVDRNYDVACVFFRCPELDIFECIFLGCGKYDKDLKLYRYFALDSVDEGTMCGEIGICKLGKCVPEPEDQVLQYVGLIKYSNCVTNDKIQNATGSRARKGELGELDYTYD